MKLVTASLLTALSLLSVKSEASTQTYVYSNVEYCQLVAKNVQEATLDAYSRKLGFTPEDTDCRQLRSAVVNTDTVDAGQIDVEKQIKRLQRGSVIRLPKSLIEKLSALPAEQRAVALQNLFS